MESQDNRNTANKCEFKRFINSIINSINGLKASYKEERSMILHLVISILVILVGFVIKINTLDWIFVILFLSTILSVELLNTAIESCVDLVTKEYHPLAKKAKDAGSAAAFSISILAGIGLFIIYLPHIMKFIK